MAESLVFIGGFSILSLNDGSRLVAKYRSSFFPDHAKEIEFEKKVFAKCSRTNATNYSDIAVVDNKTVVFRMMNDIMMICVGLPGVSELIVENFLEVFIEVNVLTFKRNLDMALTLEKMDMLLVQLDESVEQGIVLETDCESLQKRVAIYDEREMAIADQTVTQAFGILKQTLAKYT